MKTPTIHLNGTGAETLIVEANRARKALEVAREALCNITMHGRDFYPQGPDAYHAAAAEYRDMIARFDSVRDEMENYEHALWEASGR